MSVTWKGMASASGWQGEIGWALWISIFSVSHCRWKAVFQVDNVWSLSLGTASLAVLNLSAMSVSIYLDPSPDFTTCNAIIRRENLAVSTSSLERPKTQNAIQNDHKLRVVSQQRYIKYTHVEKCFVNMIYQNKKFLQRGRSREVPLYMYSQTCLKCELFWGKMYLL